MAPAKAEAAPEHAVDVEAGTVDGMKCCVCSRCWRPFLAKKARDYCYECWPSGTARPKRDPNEKYYTTYGRRGL